MSSKPGTQIHGVARMYKQLDLRLEWMYAVVCTCGYETRPQKTRELAQILWRRHALLAGR